MAPGISLDDRNAWDDTALIDSWDEAVAEYKVSCQQIPLSYQLTPNTEVLQHPSARQAFRRCIDH